MADRDDDLDPSDPFDAFLAAAPIDDEPYPEHQQRESDLAWQEHLRGEGAFLAEVRERLLGRPAKRRAVG